MDKRGNGLIKAKYFFDGVYLYKKLSNLNSKIIVDTTMANDFFLKTMEQSQFYPQSQFGILNNKINIDFSQISIEFFWDKNS